VFDVVTSLSFTSMRMFPRLNDGSLLREPRRPRGRLIVTDHLLRAASSMKERRRSDAYGMRQMKCFGQLGILTMS
jgi:hypothetical protein